MKKLTEHACRCLRQIPGYLYQAEKDIPFLQELLILIYQYPNTLITMEMEHYALYRG